MNNVPLRHDTFAPIHSLMAYLGLESGKLMILDTSWFLVGAYKNHDDLASIYGDVHFVWAIDFYEKGLNSNWLLPNRIYEGSLHGAVPIGHGDVETTRWMQSNGVGVVLSDPLSSRLIEFLDALTAQQYQAKRKAVMSIPRTKLVVTVQDCRNLARDLAGG